MIIFIIGINLLTKPNYLLYSRDSITIDKKYNGEVFISLKNVSNYDISKQYSEDNSGYNYSITTWDTPFDELFNNKKYQNVVLHYNGEKVNSIYYYSGGKLDDVLIYGNSSGDGIRITLPRLVLGPYLLISIELIIIFSVIMLLVQKSKIGRNIMMKLLPIPISYAIGTVLIKGFKTASYSLQRDFFVIIIISIPIYCLILITIDFWKNLKYK